MAASVIRVLLICFISLAYSDDFLPYGWTQSGFKHFCFEDILRCFSDGFLPGKSKRSFPKQKWELGAKENCLGNKYRLKSQDGAFELMPAESSRTAKVKETTLC